MKYPKCTPLKIIITVMILHQLIPTGHNAVVAAPAPAAVSGTVEFTYAPDFSNTTGLSYTGSVELSNGIMWMLYDPDTSTAPGKATGNLIGRLVYNQPIGFTSNSSFNTSFSLSLQISENATGNADCPSGVAFFISPDGSQTPPDNSGGRYFGLVDSATIDSVTGVTEDPLFAVVFDATKDEELKDPTESYIGIDINSLNPGSAYVNTNSKDTGYYPAFFLCTDNNFTVWISYNASSQTTQVRVMSSGATTVGNILDDPPDSTQILHLDYKKDLYSSVFSQKHAFYVGFSVTNYNLGSPPSSVAIHSWHFSVDHTGSTSSPSSTNLKLIIPLAASAIFALILTCIALSIFLHRRRRSLLTKQTCSKHTYINIESVAKLHKFSYRDLKTSTRGFNQNTSLIGEGGFSKVYKGTLRDGSVVAIKRLKDGLQKEGEFASELQIISSIRHRNLLQLQGWSYEKGEALLVYTYMSNGSLDQYLFGRKKGTLDGDTRLRILQGVAAALEYLHSGLGECILHRDVKSANVMLTNNFEAVLGDFGLARLIKHNEIVTATMVGTPGYVAPEIFMTGKVTDKVDVYSFGILMLEVACGSPAINREPNAKYLYLADWISRLQCNNNVIQGLDPSILMLCTESNPVSKAKEQWENMLELALMCCHLSPNCRPPMRYINQYIQDVISDPQTKNPSLLSFKSHSDANIGCDQEGGYLNYLKLYSSSSPHSNLTSLKYSTDYFFSNSSIATPNH